MLGWTTTSAASTIATTRSRGWAPSRSTRPLEPERADLRLERRAFLALADERAADVPPVAQQATGLDEMTLALLRLEAGDADEGRGVRGRGASAALARGGANTAGSAPQWITIVFASAVGRTSRASRRRFASEIVTTNRAERIFSSSIARSTWMSWAWAVKLYGRPLRRDATHAASVGCVAQWAWMWSRSRSTTRRAIAAPIGTATSARSRKRGERIVPRIAPEPRAEVGSHGRRRSQWSWAARRTRPRPEVVGPVDRAAAPGWTTDSRSRTSGKISTSMSEPPRAPGSRTG